MVLGVSSVLVQANEGLRQEILVRQVPRRSAWLALAKIQERLQRARDRKRKQKKDREQQLQRLYEDQDLLGLTNAAETGGVAREKALGDAQGMLGKSFVKQLQALHSMIFLKTTLKEAKSMKATELVVMLGKSTGPVAEAAKILVNAWKREVAAWQQIDLAGERDLWGSRSNAGSGGSCAGSAFHEDTDADV